MKNEELGMMSRPWIPRASFLVLAAILAFSFFDDGQPTLAKNNASVLDDGEVILGQNFPNPFSGITTIRYTIPASGSVLIRVFNTLGQEIEVLVPNDEEQTGEHQTHFDGSAFPSGQYTYVMTFTSDDDGSKTKLIKRMQQIK
jgi:hypothetical protein